MLRLGPAGDPLLRVQHVADMRADPPSPWPPGQAWLPRHPHPHQAMAGPWQPHRDPSSRGLYAPEPSPLTSIPPCNRFRGMVPWPVTPPHCSLCGL